MSSRIDTLRRARATCVVLGGVLAVAASVGAAPQDRGDPLDRLPDAVGVVEAYTAVRRWVRRFEDLPKPRDPEAQLPIERASGACVVLRLDGEPVGIGWQAAGDEPAMMVRRAAGRALGEVLRHETVARLPDDMREGVGARLTVELEIAGPLVPLAGLTVRDMAEQLDPGLEGAALRHGDRLAMLFPAALRTTNLSGAIGRMLPGLAEDVGVSLDDLADLKGRDISVYGFRTTHLAQPAPRRAPVQTQRGDVIVSIDAVSRAGIVDLAEGIVRHLRAGLWPDSPTAAARDPLGMMGDYHPDLDAYSPLVAPPLEQALVALAFARYAATPGVDAGLAERARADAARILRELAEVTDVEIDPRDDPRACAAIVYAFSKCAECEGDAEIEALAATASAVVRGSFAGETGFAPELKGHDRAIVAGGLARMLRMHGPEAIDAATVRLAVDAAWAGLPENLAVGLLPWIMWAEVDLAEATGAPLAHADRLAGLARLLEQSRITTARDPRPEADVLGGFDLTDHPIALATAQSVRPAAALAAMPRDPRLVEPSEAAAALGRHLQTIRFLMQLSVRESSWWSLPHPERAVGGLRTAPWDSTQPVAAQAMGLITAVETLQTLQDM